MLRNEAAHYKYYLLSSLMVSTQLSPSFLPTSFWPMANHRRPMELPEAGEPPAAKNLDCGVDELLGEEGTPPLVFTGIHSSS